jgi:methylmalonyl-CoA mutase cobalamin-binding subunit
MVDRLGDLPGAPLPQGRLSTPVDAATFGERAIEAIRSYDIPSLERTLDESMLAMGHSGMLERLLVPLLQRLGADWQRGEITAAQEHCATSAIKDYLARTLRPVNTPESAPRLLVTTPAGQLHEMGAAIAAGLARKSGWNVTYLGPSLPAEEIVGAVMMNNIRAVALSIVYPADDPDLPDQMVRLRSLLPDEVPIIIGGQAADAYSHVLSRIGALRVASMEDFTRVLLEVRDGNHATPAPQLAPRPESRRRPTPQEKHQA